MSREVHVRIREGVGVRLPALLDFVVLKRRLCPLFFPFRIFSSAFSSVFSLRIFPLDIKNELPYIRLADIHAYQSQPQARSLPFWSKRRKGVSQRWSTRPPKRRQISVRGGPALSSFLSQDYKFIRFLELLRSLGNAFSRSIQGEAFMGGQIFPLVEGGDKAPPEDASAQGGRRFPCREFTPFLMWGWRKFS
jgi:hypothetical protein